MASDLDICNMALGQLGDERIDSFEEPTRKAALCRLYYPTLRDALLCEGQWRFARRRQRLAETDQPAGGFQRAYQLPTDPHCLQVLHMDHEDVTPWAVEGRTLLTDATAVTILYIARIVDTGSFDGAFTLALADRLTAQLGYGITGDPDVEKIYLSKAAAQIRAALEADAQQAALLPSALTLANLALAQLGESPILTFRDNSKRATLAALFYPKVRDALLRQGHWKFARKRVTLNTPTTSPAWGYAYAYPLPSDCLQVLHLEEDDGDSWTVEGRQLLSDGASLNVVYIARVTDITQFDSEFTMALVNGLAMQLGYALTGKATATQVNADLYQESLREARHANAREGSPQGVTLPDLFTRNR